MSREWIETARQLPPEGVVVETGDSGGNVQTLVRKGGLWFVPDTSMYVYFTPVAWREVSCCVTPAATYEDDDGVLRCWNCSSPIDPATPDADDTPPPAECGAIPSNVGGPVPCHLPSGHDGEHFSTSGCAGSEIRWTMPPPAEPDAGEVERLALVLRKAARDYLGLEERDYWDSGIADAQARALLARGEAGQ